MTIILCAINNETGEVLNRDGSVAGKVVPSGATPEMVSAYLSANHLYWQAQDCIPRPADKWCNGTPSDATAQSYKAMLSASRVDLSGCEVPIPKQGEVRETSDPVKMYSFGRIEGWNAAIQSILNQMPKVKK